VRLLHSADTVVHLVTTLEDLPVTETLETVAELDAAQLRCGAVIVNRADPRRLPTRSVDSAADGRWTGCGCTPAGVGRHRAHRRAAGRADRGDRGARRAGARRGGRRTRLDEVTEPLPGCSCPR